MCFGTILRHDYSARLPRISARLLRSMSFRAPMHARARQTASFARSKGAQIALSRRWRRPLVNSEVVVPSHMRWDEKGAGYLDAGERMAKRTEDLPFPDSR